MKRFIMVLAVAALMAAMLAAMAVPAFATLTPRQGNNGLIDAAYKSGFNAHPPCFLCSPDTPYTYFPDRP